MNLHGAIPGRRLEPHLEKSPQHAHHYLFLFPFQKDYCDVSVLLVWPISRTSPLPPRPGAPILWHTAGLSNGGEMDQRLPGRGHLSTFLVQGSAHS